jgi:lipoate-protein ligase A
MEASAVVQPGWRVLVDPGYAGEAHMRLDAQLAAEPHPTLRLFQWHPPAISIGWKQPWPEWLAPERFRAAGVAVVERPTGGGSAFHGSEVSCAGVVPRHLSWSLPLAMAMVCEAAAACCRLWHADVRTLPEVPARERITVCLAERSSYAVYADERKLAGFALRRYPESWLIHGSLLVAPLPEAFRRVVPAEVLATLEANAISLSEAVGALLRPDEVARQWAAHWTQWMEAVLETVLV